MTSNLVRIRTDQVPKLDQWVIAGEERRKDLTWVPTELN